MAFQIHVKDAVGNQIINVSADTADMAQRTAMAFVDVFPQEKGFDVSYQYESGVVGIKELRWVHLHAQENPPSFKKMVVELAQKNNEAACDQCKAGVQLRALDTIFFMGHMNRDQALRELGLIEEQYAQLADAEGLQGVALAIREEMQY